MSLKDFALHVLTWWNGQTPGTRFHTWRYGEFMGTDQFGNKYYRTKGGKMDPALGFDRRWVIYAGETEASVIPPGWRGWLAHTTDLTPDQEDFKPRPWMKEHVANQTGTPNAYRPRGSTLATGERPAATGDYVAWTPKE